MRNDIVENREKLENDLLDLVADEGRIDRDLLKPEAALTDLDIASADFIMILMAIEEKFGVYISVDNEMSDLKTVGDLLNVSVKKIEENADA